MYKYNNKCLLAITVVRVDDDVVIVVVIVSVQNSRARPIAQSRVGWIEGGVGGALLSIARLL